jgi:hypothetical protein
MLPLFIREVFASFTSDYPHLFGSAAVTIAVWFVSFDLIFLNILY